MQLNPSEISDLIKSRIQNLQLAATARNEARGMYGSSLTRSSRIVPSVSTQPPAHRPSPSCVTGLSRGRTPTRWGAVIQSSPRCCAIIATSIPREARDTPAFRLRVCCIHVSVFCCTHISVLRRRERCTLVCYALAVPRSKQRRTQQEGSGWLTHASPVPVSSQCSRALAE